MKMIVGNHKMATAINSCDQCTIKKCKFASTSIPSSCPLPNTNTIYITNVRPDVIEFAVEMEKVLRDNDYKGGWDGCTIRELVTVIENKVVDLKQTQLSDKTKEAIDIANYAMMVFNVIRTRYEK